MSRSDLDDLIETKSKEAVAQAIRELGLNDADASGDMREMRALLKSWREMRKQAIGAVVKFLTTALLGALLLGLGIKLGAGNLLK